MKAWLQAQLQCEKQGLGYVLITVSQVQGSAPRSVGAKILVTHNAQFDSIGGGHVEYKAIARARQLLKNGVQASGNGLSFEDYALGASLGQCCGGKVQLMYELVTPTFMPVVVFGAGHVGRALVPMLAHLPVAVTWVDGRYDMLPKQIPDGVNCVHEEHPVDAIADCPANACYLIMTHHHGLDLQRAEAALKRGDSRYVGVIGSRTKAAKFRHRLLDKGLAEAMSVFACPMGDKNITGKLPMEVAVSVAAQVMKLYQQEPMAKPVAGLVPEGVTASTASISTELV